ARFPSGARRRRPAVARELYARRDVRRAEPSLGAGAREPRRSERVHVPPAAGRRKHPTEEPMKVKGGMLDADGHLIERDEELLEYTEAPYKGNNTLLGFPFFPTLDGYHRGAIMARLGIHKGYTINAKTWLEFLDGTGIESTVLYPTA